MIAAKRISLIFCLLILIYLGAAAQPLPPETLDSLRGVAEDPKESSLARGEAWCALCQEARLTSKLDEALVCGEQGLALLRQSGNKVKQADCLSTVAGALYFAGKPDSALALMNQSVKLYEAAEAFEKMATALNNIGLIYTSRGELSRSLRTYRRGMKSAIQRRDTAALALLNTNISTVYRLKEDYPQALVYNNKAIALLRELGDQRGEANALNNMGIIYDMLKDFGQANRYYRKCLEVNQKIGNIHGVAGARANLAANYHLIGDYAAAAKEGKLGVAAAEAAGDPSMLAAALNALAAANLGVGKLAAARAAAARADKLARQVGTMEVLRDNALTQYKLDSAAGDHKAALAAHLEYTRLKDSLDNAAQDREIGRIEAEFAFDKEIADRERAEEAAAAERRRNYWIAGGAFAFLLAFAGLLFAGFQAKRKTNETLKLKNEEISQRNEEISQQSQQFSLWKNELLKRGLFIFRDEENNSIQRLLFRRIIRDSPFAEVFKHYGRAGRKQELFASRRIKKRLCTLQFKKPVALFLSTTYESGSAQYAGNIQNRDSSIRQWLAENLR